MQPIQTVLEQYLANISYEQHGSVSEAQLFLSAALELDLRKPTKVTIDGNATEFNFRALPGEIARCRKWLAAHGGLRAAGDSHDGRYYYDQSNICGE